MIIDDVFEYLATNVTRVTLTKGTNLFKGFLPDTPADCVCIFDTGGAEPDKDLPIGNPTFQVFVRNKSYATGHNIINQIYALLNRKRNVALVTGETYFYNIYALGNPGSIGRDENGRDEFTVNFVGHIREWLLEKANHTESLDAPSAASFWRLNIFLAAG